MEDINQFVIFKVGAEEYAVPILKVNEIIRLKGIRITEVPNTKKYVVGIINLRGEVVPIMDLRMKFHMPKKEMDDNTRIMIVSIQGDSIGFLVDSVSEVAQIPSGDIIDPPEEVSDVDSKFITKIAKYSDRIFIILDVDSIVSDKPGEPDGMKSGKGEGDIG
jgi:purine-binding chemotaxis protein CheW